MLCRQSIDSRLLQDYLTLAFFFNRVAYRPPFHRLICAPELLLQLPLHREGTWSGHTCHGLWWQQRRPDFPYIFPEAARVRTENISRDFLYHLLFSIHIFFELGARFSAFVCKLYFQIFVSVVSRVTLSVSFGSIRARL